LSAIEISAQTIFQTILKSSCFEGNEPAILETINPNKEIVNQLKIP
jgi:hypothetical protein